MAANPLVQLVTKLKGSKPGALTNLEGSSIGHLFVVNYLPVGAQVAMDGEAFATLGTTATACVQADPGTAAATAIYNDEPTGGKTWIFDEIYAAGAASAAAIEDTMIYAAVFPTQASKPAATQTSAMNMKGGGPAIANLRIAFAITLDAAPIWKPIQTGVHASAVNDNGQAMIADISSRPFIVPPQTGLALHCAGTSATNTYFHGGHFIVHQFDSTGN